MNWKIIIGGAGLGVVGVALAPFTGGGSIAGAIALGEALTIGGTVVGAGIGAGVGAILSEDAKKEGYEKGKQKGYEKGKAENAVEIAKLKEYLEQTKDIDNYFKILIVMESIAVACINYYGIDVKDKQEEISDLLRSLSNDIIPQNIQNKINTIYNNPPNIKEAFTLAKNENLDKDICENIIILTVSEYGINSDKILIKLEKTYI